MKTSLWPNNKFPHEVALLVRMWVCGGGGGLGVSSYLETFLDLFEPLNFSLRLGKCTHIFIKQMSACLRSHCSIFAKLK